MVYYTSGSAPKDAKYVGNVFGCYGSERYSDNKAYERAEKRAGGRSQRSRRVGNSMKSRQ